MNQLQESRDMMGGMQLLLSNSYAPLSKLDCLAKNLFETETSSRASPNRHTIHIDLVCQTPHTP
jgi:hypothetical protein